jgi:transposase
MGCNSIFAKSENSLQGGVVVLGLLLLSIITWKHKPKTNKFTNLTEVLIVLSDTSQKQKKTQNASIHIWFLPFTPCVKQCGSS